jgi:hypothetical protein
MGSAQALADGLLTVAPRGGEEQREVLRAGMGMGATEVLIGEG